MEIINKFRAAKQNTLSRLRVTQSNVGFWGVPPRKVVTTTDDEPSSAPSEQDQPGCRPCRSGKATGFKLLAATTLMLSVWCSGCGSSVTPAGLLGSWQVDLPSRHRIVYTFYPDGTYTMKMAGAPGALTGTWVLSSARLTMAAGDFRAYGVTNAFSTSPALTAPVQTITSLTPATMKWRGNGLTQRLTLKRIASTAPQEQEKDR